MLIAEWSRAEYRALAAAALGTRSKRDVDVLARALSPMFAGKPLHLVGQGRLAITIALRLAAERAPGRSEVIVPAYICPSVLDAVERAGLRSVPADVGADFNIDAAEVGQSLTPRTLAVVAAHMYACPAAIADIERICLAAGVHLIDDAAQVLGVAAADRPLGCFGHFGIASFSEVKSLTAGATNAGGALIVNDASFEAAARRAVEALPAGSYRASDFIAFLEDGPLHRTAAALRYRIESLTGRKRSPRICPPARMSNAAAAVALRQLDSFPARRTGRIRVAQAYERFLAGSGLALPQFAPGRYLTRVMVLLPEGTALSPLRAALRRQGLQTRAGYALGERNRKALRRVPDLDRRLIELPNRSTLAEDEIAWICSTLLHALGNDAPLASGPPRPHSGRLEAEGG